MQGGIVVLRVSCLIALGVGLASAAAADPPRSAALPPHAIETCFSNFSAAQDTTKMQPKDFCLVDGGDAWHLFYTRQYTTPNYANDRTNTHSIGHAVSTDRHLSSWTIVDRA